ncbi:MAG: hypothetical protein J5590_05295, partial [Clostridia bacterium]|nr:hypothetical protein [Clostridia bacterium]
KEVTGFVPSQDHPGLYEANVDGVDRIMQIYVNGKKRWMARSNEFVKGLAKNNNYNWNDPDTDYTYDGLYMSKNDIGFWENPNDIIFEWERHWKTQMVYPEEILQDPDNADQVIVRMQRGFWQILVSQNYSSEGVHLQEWESMYPEANAYFRIINAMELLDSTGEFYYNRATKKLYYMPEADEDMSTATVVVPRIDHFATIYGRDWTDCVTNVDFRGLTIAHFASNAVAEGYWGEQGTVARPASGTQGVGRCGIYMFFCDNVNFSDNYFYGFDEVCINMQGGVRNCSVTGNAFSDIGDAAVTIGHERHANKDDNSYTAAPSGDGSNKMVLTRDFERAAIYTSYIGDAYSSSTKTIYPNKGLNFIGNLNGNEVSGGAGVNKSYMPSNSGYKYTGYHWLSDPADVGKKKSYVMYDFYSKFTIDKVVLCWDSNLINTAQRSNFEVLLSNDKSFAEGTYVTLRKVGQNSQKVLEINNTQYRSKYRYLMIRTTGNTQFGLSQVYACTPDLTPYTFAAEPKNITVSNNYMTRIGGEIPRSCAIMAYYVKGLNIEHNDLFDIAYSGIEIGWGWSESSSYTRNVNCRYNSIDTTCHMLYDGGPIYTLGPQGGDSANDYSLYEYNYLNNCILGVHSLYTDSASQYTKWQNNVVENCHNIISPYTETIKHNIYSNNYATHGIMNIWSNSDNTRTAYDNNTIENPKQFSMGQPPAEAKAIIDGAGLEDNYKQIKEWVPEDVENGLPEEAVSYTRAREYSWDNRPDGYNKMHKDEAEYMYNYGVFGEGEGKYPLEYQTVLEDAINCYPYNTSNPFLNPATAKQTTLLRNLMKDIKESAMIEEPQVPVDPAETLAEIQKTMADIQAFIDNARIVSDNCPCLASFSGASLYDTFGMMTKSSFDDIKARYQALNNRYLGGITENEYDEFLTAAQKLLDDAQSAVFNADIVYASTDGAKDVNIDTENKVVTFYFEPGTSLANKTLDLAVSPGAIIASNNLDNVDLSTPLTVTVYCTRNKGYKYWTVKAEYADDSNVSLFGSAAGSGYTDPDNWFSLRRGDKHVSPTCDGGLIIQKGAFATMSKIYDANTKGASFTFAPLSQSGKHQFTMIVASQDYEIDNTIKSETVDRLEIDFVDNIANVYLVKDGKRGDTPKTTATTTLKYNEPNTISISSTIQGSVTRVDITINGQKFSAVIYQKLNKGYFGFNTQKCNIKIY